MKLAKIYSLIFIPPLAQYVITLEEVDGSRLICSRKRSNPLALQS